MPPEDAKPAAAKKPPQNPAIQMGLLTLGFIAIANVAFFFLSDVYFQSKAKDVLAAGSFDATALAHARIAFGVFTMTIGIASVVATIAPRWIGHGIAAAMGVASLLAAVAAYLREMPGVLPATLLVIGGALPILAYYSLQRARAAWSFLVGLCGVYATVLLFGAPKVRGVLGIGLWTALIIPGMLVVATVALAMVRDQYREAD